MKKAINIFLLIITCLILVGCNNDKKEEQKKEESIPNDGKLVCQKNDFDDDGYAIDSTITIEYKDKKITKLSSSANIETSYKKIDSTINELKTISEALTSIEGIDLSAIKTSDTYYKEIVTIDYAKYDVTKMKETIGENISQLNPMYTEENTSISDFKSKYLSDYTCH